MGALGFIIVLLLVSHYSAKNKPRDSTRQKRSQAYLAVWLIYIALVTGCALLVFPVKAQSPWLFYAASIILAGYWLVLLPSLWAQLCIVCGWVKPSFYLGRIAYCLHQRDIFGGALFFGWRALRRSNTQETDHLWLQQRLAQYKGTLGSSAMLMHTLLHAEGKNYPQLLAQFTILQGLNKNWILPALARSAWRFILARACSEGDFAEIRRQARYWQLVGNNAFAQWVDMYHWSLGAQKIPFGLRVKLRWLYFWVGNAQLKQYLVQLAGVQTPAAADLSCQENLIHREFSLLQSGAGDQAPLNNAWQDYLREQLDAKWQQRCVELGCFNSIEALQQLRHSVLTAISLRSGGADMNNEQAVQERDNHFKLLRIKIHALVNRCENQQLMTGMQEFEEFMALVRVAAQLGKDDHTRGQIYFQLRSPLWNWMAELWNNTQNRPLAFLAGSYLAPLAQEFGDTEAHTFFSGLVNHRFN